jgi:hypothetical protein
MRYAAMQQEQSRPRLQLRTLRQDPAETRLALVSSAIRNHVSLRARYNGQSVLLAPQILFTRNGAAHVDAAVLEREGKRDEELRLRTFNLTGLHELRTSGRHFTPQSFDLGEEKYAKEEVKILAVSGGGAPSRPTPVQCSAERPWGIHPRLDDGGTCPRCGWRSERA